MTLPIFDKFKRNSASLINPSELKEMTNYLAGNLDNKAKHSSAVFAFLFKFARFQSFGMPDTSLKFLRFGALKFAIKFSIK